MGLALRKRFLVHGNKTFQISPEIGSLVVEHFFRNGDLKISLEGRLCRHLYVF